MLKRFVLALSAILLTAGPALAQDAVSEAPLPRSMASPFRIIPVAGASNLATTDTVNADNLADGFSAGLFADFGSRMWTFETGVLSLNSDTAGGGNAAALTVNTWGIPLLGKVNFSGNPHSTVFLKAGAMPFQATGDADTSFDVMGVGGIGGHIPLGRNSSLLLDATYNRLFTENGDLTNYQGLAFLAGLSLNI